MKFLFDIAEGEFPEVTMPSRKSGEDVLNAVAVAQSSFSHFPASQCVAKICILTFQGPQLFIIWKRTRSLGDEGQLLPI